MNNFLRLLKIELIETFDRRRLKEDKAKTLTTSTLVMLAILGGIALSSWISYFYCRIFKLINENYIYSMMILSAFVIMLIINTAVFKAKSIFVGKDHEMLSSMPIKKSEIVAAKITSLYLVELLYSVVILVPNGVVCTIFSHNVLFIFTSLIVGVLLPAVPVVICSLLSIFIALVADRYKFGNIISTFLYILLFIGVFFLSFSISSQTEVSNQYLNVANVAKYIDYSIVFITKAHLENYLYILAFVCINFVALILGVFLIALLYDKVYDAANIFHTSSNSKAKAIVSHKQLRTLFNVEAKRFFTSKMYFVNSLMSGIASLFCGVIIAIQFKTNLTEDYMYILKDYGYFAPLAIMICLGISVPSAVTLNMEGENLAVIKSMPIDYKKLAKAKLYFSALFTSILGIITCIATICIVNIGLFNSIMFVVDTILYALCATNLGLFVNMYFIKTDWKSEAEACKQSASVVITMIIDLVICIACAGILIGFTFVNKYLAIFGTFGFLLILAIVLYILIIKKFGSKIEKLEL